MVDSDPGLDSKLRAFFEQIEASAPPSGLTDIDVAPRDRPRRMLNMFAAVAAAAVVAASVAVFALVLRSRDQASPAPAVTSAPPSASSSSSPLASQLKKMPLLGNAGVPASAHVVIPVITGRGSEQLRTFVPQGTLYVQFDCIGPGPFKIASTNHVIGNGLLQCSGSFDVTTMTVGSPKIYDNKPLTFQVTADPSMSWEVFVAQSRAPLPQFTVTPDEQVLVPVTYGNGPITLPTFSVPPDETLNVESACNSGSSADTLEMVGNGSFGDDVQYQCTDPGGVAGSGGFGSGPVGTSSGPITVHVKADPSIGWEILITAGPGPLELESSGTVAIEPDAFGMGPSSLPAFTPTQTYSIAVVCSGAGTLTIGSSSFMHIATPKCIGLTASFTPAGQVRGQPLSLTVDAPPSMGWHIYIFYNGSTGMTCPVVIPAGTPAQRAAIRTHYAALCAARGR
jgi:hypothetical protein